MFNHLAKNNLQDTNNSYQKIIFMLNHKISNFLKAARYKCSMKDGSSYIFYLTNPRKNQLCRSIKMIQTFLYDRLLSMYYTFCHSSNSNKNIGKENTLNHQNHKLIFKKIFELFFYKFKILLHPVQHKHELKTNSLFKLISHYVQPFLPLSLH